MDDDDDFLNELNELSQKIKKEPKLIENSDIITPIKNNIESKEDSKNLLEAKKELEKNINKINEQFKFMNESNPFIEAFNNNNNNNINEKDLSNLFNELELNLNGMNNIMEDFLKKENLSNENNNTNGKDYEMKMFENVLDYLIKFDLLKETILNMKKSINEAFEKNKETLNENEKNKYEESIKCANLILEEISKSNFDKQKIIDNLYNLQQIAEIENLNII
jgi:DNA-binding XRE family transcriptional regulator